MIRYIRTSKITDTCWDVLITKCWRHASLPMYRNHPVYLWIVTSQRRTNTRRSSRTRKKRMGSYGRSTTKASEGFNCSAFLKMNWKKLCLLPALSPPFATTRQVAFRNCYAAKTLLLSGVYGKPLAVVDYKNGFLSTGIVKVIRNRD